ncbi:E3 ubiquitin-protein ligase CCNB1IP1-like [Ostrea edulis]|uniref:E3 ubiquitin-protein ligase CCNB1IP1-like n=1 Tax=Ostrea edulis TaxID=37623 RepID=UPI0024AFEABF|nr:E3 ubiquitin-protein ligase CCNB1IP1-like [Ostrea edulis]
MESELVCNHKKCRKRVEDYAWITSCSHIFCDEDGVREFKNNNSCPACSTDLSDKLDIIRIEVNPSEKYKSMVLAGKRPEMIMEICSRAMSFWSYQIHQERVYQEYVCSKAKERATQLEQYYEQVISQTSAELNSLKSQLTATKKELESFKKKYQDASEKVADKYRKYQKLQAMYDALKRKCITPSTFEGGDAVNNDRARNALSNFMIPIGSDHGISCPGSIPNSRKGSPEAASDVPFSFRPTGTPILTQNGDHPQTKNGRNQHQPKNKNLFDLDFPGH